MKTQSAKPIKVLLNVLSARQGGGQTYVLNLLAHLPAYEGFKVFVLAPDSLPLPTGDPRVEKLPVTAPVGNPFIRALWERREIPRLISAVGADALFCPGGILGSRLPNGCKSVTMSRNLIPFDAAQMQRYGFGYMRLRNFLLQRAFVKSMQRADLVIFLSDYARQIIQSCLTERLQNAVTIPHGISPDFRPNPHAESQPVIPSVPSGPYLLYASTLDFYKAQLEVVRAYALLRERRPTVEKLLLVGSEYAEYGRLVRREIDRLGLGESVKITGPLPYRDMPAIYQNATVNIFASECENCPNILIEALASGRPVLSSHFPPMPEFAGDAALYFDPRSPEDLAGKLAALLDDAGRMKKLAAVAEERSRLFDWQICARKTWESIYHLTLN